MSHKIVNKLDENKQWFDSWARTYDRGILGPWLRAVQNHVIETLNLNKNTSVLDVGCGTGYLVEQLSGKITQGKLAGIDVSSKMIHQAIQKFSGKNNVELLVANVEELPYKNSTFDYVVTTDAFHHFPNSSRALSEMKRVLKVNGTIIIADVHIPPTVLGNLLFKLEPGFSRMYSCKDMQVLARGVGLRVVEQHRTVLFAMMHILKP